MRRRDFVKALGVGGVAWPFGAFAQPSKRVRRIGVLTAPLTNPIATIPYRAFLAELDRLGFKEGQNLEVEFRSNEREFDAVRAAASEIVRTNVEVMFTVGGGPQADAAIAASANIPVVILGVNYDPIARGHVKTLARPGGNTTGVFLQQTEVAEKQVELLTQAFPRGRRLAVLWDDVSAEQFAAASRRAALMNLEVRSLKLENPPYDFDAAFQMLAAGQPEMLLVLSSQFFARFDKKIADLAIHHRMPSMFIFKGYVRAGGLLSYGADFEAMFRQCAPYVAKILNGTSPLDLPVEQPNKFDLVVNLKTAKAIGADIPPAILLRANEVIE